MYIPIENNSRGSLEISQTALNKLLHLAATGDLPKQLAPKDVWVGTEVYQDNLLYILIKITLPKGFKSADFDEKKMIRLLEKLIQQTLNTKPKNIAIAYSRK